MKHLVIIFCNFLIWWRRVLKMFIIKKKKIPFEANDQNDLIL